MAGGSAVAAVGLAMLTQVGHLSALAILVGGSLVLGFGAALVFTLSTDLVLGSAPPERAGTASGISETGAELGGALGIAILGSLGTAVYRQQIDGALPEDAPAGAAETLGGALDAADALSAKAVEAAIEAFTQGMRLAAVASAVLMVAMAAIAARVLRTPEERAESAPGGVAAVAVGPEA